MAEQGDRFVRACNYFTVWRLAGKHPRNVQPTWVRLKATADMSVPLPELEAPQLGYLEFGMGLVQETFEQVRSQMDRLERSDIILERGEPGYPKELEKVDGSPEFLFVRGNVALLHEPALAVVGTRNPSELGLRRAHKLGHLLAEQGIVVASGLAKGIDRAAHLGALSVGGNTVAVIGTPLTQAYPREHEDLQRRIGEVGAVVSQFYPGAEVQPFNFPMRNAVMSGLSLGTIVVEASETSGALIQARQCLKQGRKLFIPQSAVEDQVLRWPRTFLRRPNVYSFKQIEDLLNALEREKLFSWTMTSKDPDADIKHRVTPLDLNL